MRHSTSHQHDIHILHKDLLVFSWERVDSGRLSEHLDTLLNLVPVPFCRRDGLQMREYTKDRGCHEKDIVVVGG